MSWVWLALRLHGRKLAHCSAAVLTQLSRCCTLLPQDLTAEQVADFKASLRQRYLEPPKSLADAAGRPWHKIHDGTHDFSHRADKAAALEPLLLEDLLTFYDEHLRPGAAGERLLVAQVWGGRQGGDEAALASLAAADSIGAVCITDSGLPAFKAAWQKFDGFT